ncbi:MAG: DUF350 domain-containing protein [Nevskia sp.]|jgi:putative membrane protein|nr:DUF350 domain-containing protein [Nevskia sp.]MCK9386664.1 DUF350 domain-containing protein [Nevskia sp.]
MSEYLIHLQAFLQWLGLSLLLAGAFIALYVWITPPHELKLIRGGNVSAAVMVGGTVLGYVLPLASALVHGANLIDFLIWGVIAMLVQLALYLVMRLAYPKLTQDIVEDRVSVAILAAALALATGILNAASMVG